MKLKTRNNYLLRKYGITDEQFQQMLDEQNGCCAVCGKHQREFKTRLCIDHDHDTMAIRGLLCQYCNRRVVGRYRKGNGSCNLLIAAYNYLTRDYPGWIIPSRKKRRCAKKRKKHPKVG